MNQQPKRIKCSAIMSCQRQNLRAGDLELH